MVLVIGLLRSNMPNVIWVSMYFFGFTSSYDTSCVIHCNEQKRFSSIFWYL